MAEPATLSDGPPLEARTRIDDLLRRRRYRAARSAAARWFALEPENPLAESMAIALQRVSGRDAMAARRARLAELVRKHPNLLHPRILEAQTRFALGERDEAIADMQRVLATADDPGRVELCLLSMHSNAGRWTEGWRHAVAARRHDPPLDAVNRFTIYLVGHRAGAGTFAWSWASAGASRLERLGMRLRPFLDGQLVLTMALAGLAIATGLVAVLVVATALAVFLWIQTQPAPPKGLDRILILTVATAWIVFVGLELNAEEYPYLRVVGILLAGLAVVRMARWRIRVRRSYS